MIGLQKEWMHGIKPGGTAEAKAFVPAEGAEAFFIGMCCSDTHGIFVISAQSRWFFDFALSPMARCFR